MCEQRAPVWSKRIMTVGGNKRRLVVDNGSHYCRAGFSDEDGPSSCERALVLRPRRREDGQVFSLVGEVPAELLVGTDAARAPLKSPFEHNIVINFDCQETILDFVFSRIPGLGEGNEAGALEQEVVLTECVLTPRASRRTMAELMFETYGCPGLHVGPDCTFAYAHNRVLDPERVRSDGIVVGLGHSASTVVPIVSGSPDLDRALRMNLSGMGLTTQLQRCLEVKHGKSLNRKDHPLSAFNLCERVKAACCFVARDYREALRGLGRMPLCECPEAEDLLPGWDVSAAVERVQIPEIYFQPSIAGVDQLSVTDTVEACCSAGGAPGWDSDLLRSILLTGGSSRFQGMPQRLQRELRERCRVGTQINVFGSADATLDAWRGAADYSRGLVENAGRFAHFVDRATWEEVGENCYSEG